MGSCVRMAHLRHTCLEFTSTVITNQLRLRAELEAKELELGQSSHAETQLSNISGPLAHMMEELPDSAEAVTEIERLAGCSVWRSPETVKLHPAMEDLGWSGRVDELNRTARA